ncbi:hypothetical protein KKA15_03155 [Patescibacteria group bacterium]|nr:hypothetical protein [Patescibacteria group bacterium]
MKLKNNIKKFKSEYDQVAKILFLMLVILVIFTRPFPHNANDQSRIATIESLVERNTWVIDESHFGQLTVDKVIYQGNLYSSKPAVLTIMGTGVYTVLHDFFNLDFHSATKRNAYYWLTLFIIGGSTLILLWYFFLSTRWLEIKPIHRLYLTLILGLGTFYLPYSTTFNNHTIAGALLFIGFYYYLKQKHNEGKKSLNLFLSGLFVSWAAVIDIPLGGIFLLVFFVMYLHQTRKIKDILFYVVGSTPFLLSQIIINYKLFKSFFHLHIDSRTIEFVDYWANPRGIDTLHQNKFEYLFHILLGTHGLLLYTPILILSFIVVFKIILYKKHKYWHEALLVLIGFIILTTFYVVKTGNFGGTSYGFRYYIGLAPFLIFFLAFLFEPPYWNQYKRIILYLFIVSFIFSAVGVIEVYNCPPYKAIGVGEYVFFPLLGNLSLFYELIKFQFIKLILLSYYYL